MRTRLLILIVVAALLYACGPKSYSETSVGKAKWRYYNKTQYGLRADPPKF